MDRSDSGIAVEVADASLEVRSLRVRSLAHAKDRCRGAGCSDSSRALREAWSGLSAECKSLGARVLPFPAWQVQVWYQA